MEIFFALLALYAGKSPLPENFPHKGQWSGNLIVFLSALEKWLSKQSTRRRIETPSRPLWRHCGVYVTRIKINQSMMETSTAQTFCRTWSDCRVSMLLRSRPSMMLNIECVLGKGKYKTIKHNSIGKKLQEYIIICALSAHLAFKTTLRYFFLEIFHTVSIGCRGNDKLSRKQSGTQIWSNICRS